jgi:hypothetical protein
MAGGFQGSCSGTTLTLTTEFGQWEFPHDKEKQNKKSLSIFLRAWRDPFSGKPSKMLEKSMFLMSIQPGQDSIQSKN